MLLVAALILMTTLIAVPTLARSYRGARLRASARTIIMAHRQARALAALRQESFALILDTVQNRIELVALHGTSGAVRPDPVEFETTPESIGSNEDPAPAVETEWIRDLADHIRIVQCSVENQEPEHEGLYWVRYSPGGSMDRFDLTLSDEQDHLARIQIDPITGRIEASYD